MTVATPPAASSARAFSQDLTPDGVLVLTLDVPGEKVNTLGKGMMQELLTLLGEIEARTDVRAIVLRSGKPDNFIAGADIKDFATIRSSLEGETLSRQGQGVLDRLEALAGPGGGRDPRLLPGRRPRDGAGLRLSRGVGPSQDVARACPR